MELRIIYFLFLIRFYYIILWLNLIYNLKRMEIYDPRFILAISYINVSENNNMIKITG